MELSVGPVKVHAISTGEIKENSDGSIEMKVKDREDLWKGKLFLNKSDVEALHKYFCGIRRIH
jgi:hypothetical protein